MKKNNIYFFSWNYFSTAVVRWDKTFDSNKFIKAVKKNRQQLFNKKFLVGDMVFNIIYFCMWHREMSNTANYSNSIVKLTNYLNSTIFLQLMSPFYNYNYYNSLKFQSIISKKKFFFKLQILLKNNFIFFYNLLLNNFKNFNFLKKDYFNNKIRENKNKYNDENLVWAFLFVRSSWNNFFVTVVDNQGNTLINRTGGNSEWTGSRQRATVFSADSALYEACFLAKQRGVEVLSLHLLSTFRLSQVKNSIDGLETADLKVDELIYRPKKAIGGCWKKKLRRV